MPITNTVAHCSCQPPRHQRRQQYTIDTGDKITLLYLGAVQEEADHEDGGPLQPAHGGGHRRKGHEHGRDAQGVGNDDLLVGKER